MITTIKLINIFITSHFFVCLFFVGFLVRMFRSTQQIWSIEYGVTNWSHVYTLDSQKLLIFMMKSLYVLTSICPPPPPFSPWPPQSILCSWLFKILHVSGSMQLFASCLAYSLNTMPSVLSQMAGFPPFRGWIIFSRVIFYCWILF